jgi:hypothetical protein
MLLDPFLYDFVADHQRALRKAAELAAHGRARMLCWRPVIPCVQRFTSWGIPSGIRPPSTQTAHESRGHSSASSDGPD